MKKIVIFFLAIAILMTSCIGQSIPAESSVESDNEVASMADETNNFLKSTEPVESLPQENVENNSGDSVPDLLDLDLSFSGLEDPNLLQYIEDDIYMDLERRFASDDYIVENVNAIYISKEYLEELEYNSQATIYFGYTLEELNKQFQGKRYIFTLGDDGQTKIEELEEVFDNSYSQVLKNVAIGGGLILICITVTIISKSAGATTISTIFAASAKSGTKLALSSGALSGVQAGITRGMETGDFGEAVEAAAYAGSESFKWGALSGALVGGSYKAYTLHTASTSKSIPTPREAEERAFEKFEDARREVAFKDGEEVARTTPGSTRPDILWKNEKGQLEAIEVKNYNLNNANGVNSLCTKLHEQISDRVKHLPPGSVQRVILNTEGRDYSEEIVNNAVSKIKNTCIDVYPDLRVDIMK